MRLQEDPNNTSLWFSLAQAYHQELQVDRSIACLERVVQIDPQHQNAWHNLGETYFNLKNNISKAKECWKKALGIKPDDYEDWHNLAVAYAAENNIKETEHCYQQALYHNLAYVPSLFNLGLLYSDIGDEGKARQLIGKAAELDPSINGRVAGTRFEYLLK